MHPEVKYIGLLTLLYAGTTSRTKNGFKYSLNIVTKLKLWSKSADNSFKYNKTGISETLCDETVINTEKVNLISVHVPIHSKPTGDQEFGHYLAGLIDGDGHFSSAQQLVIVFNILDAPLAYYIKAKLGYGTVKKVKDKNAVILVIAAKKGVERVISLVNGKLRTENKKNQIIKNIFNSGKFTEYSQGINLTLNIDNDLNNLWLAGFSDADASFQIKLIHRNHKTEVRLNFQIDQKKADILLKIKQFLGGNIGYRKSQDTYYYGLTSFGSAYNVINYFDRYHLLSSKHVNYLKWRKAYIIVQNKDHLNSTGLDKITKFKNTMNRLTDTTV